MRCNWGPGPGPGITGIVTAAAVGDGSTTTVSRPVPCIDVLSMGRL